FRFQLNMLLAPWANACRAAEARECDEEQYGEDKVERGEDAEGAGGSAVSDERGRRESEGEFFERRRDNQRTIAAGVGGDDHEGDLPGGGDAQEAVEVFGVRDGGWVVEADPAFQKVLR